MFSGNTNNMSTLKPRGSDYGIKRVMSAFIRQMSEDRLLIPETNINLLDIVGQGKDHSTSQEIKAYFTLMYLPGEFGVVYRGTLTDWKEQGRDVVAIKTLKGTLATNSKYI